MISNAPWRLARYLASDRFSRVRTVAYIPATVEGHAVLAVLACEEIIIAPDARLGAAGRGETTIDATMVAAYREIAERRRTIPAPVVLGMLDSRLAVTEVQLVGGGTRYVLPDELETLRAEAKIWKENRVAAEGDLVRDHRQRAATEVRICESSGGGSQGIGRVAADPSGFDPR